MEIVLLLLIAIALTAYIAIQLAAAQEVTVHTVLTSQQVFQTVSGTFNAKLNTVRRDGNTMTVKARYKRDAPVFAVEAAPNTDGGCDVTFAMQEWTSGRHRLGRSGLISIPLGRAHALWVLRKRLTITRRIHRLESTGKPSVMP